MASSANLHKARNAKNDEFYTIYEDIEKELQHYKNQLKDKIVYCNCDNAEWSNFYKYFKNNFHTLQLKQLISTYYLPETIKEDGTKEHPEVFKTIYNGVSEVKVKLKGNGDFRSQECIDILKEADIVVTNPPFSLFRQYVAQLIEYKKRFLIIGNQNAITYKEVFPLIKDNKLWLGNNFVKSFKKPSGEIQKFGNICWFTNLDFKKRNESLELKNIYLNEKYPHYENYDAINVNKISEIPMDYNGAMGVPITFLFSYNPKQFQILGCSANPESNDLVKKPRSEKVLEAIKKGNLIGAKCVGGNSNLILDKDGYLHVIYHRVFIKLKEEQDG